MSLDSAAVQGAKPTTPRITNDAAQGATAWKRPGPTIYVEEHTFFNLCGMAALALATFRDLYCFVSPSVSFQIRSLARILRSYPDEENH